MTAAYTQLPTGQKLLMRCGCVVETDEPSGVLKSTFKCPEHKALQRDPATLGEAYYAAFGLVKDGKPQKTDHVYQLVEALGGFTDFECPGPALEIGCGASPYVDAILAVGHEYFGVDASPWAAKWTHETYGVATACGEFEGIPLGYDYRLILAAHVLEHVDDAPRAIINLARRLSEKGELWLIVPDDSDPTNPDHKWFFTPDTLRACVESAGLVVEKMAVRRYIEREQFIYARARKPG